MCVVERSAHGLGRLLQEGLCNDVDLSTLPCPDGSSVEPERSVAGEEDIYVMAREDVATAWIQLRHGGCRSRAGILWVSRNLAGDVWLG